MPWGDRTGPEGSGPMTGRGLGYCAGYNSPGYTKGVPRGGFGRDIGRGFGRGRGYGRGFHHSYRQSFYPVPAPVNPSYDPELADREELDYLKYTAKSLENELEAIKRRIDELKPEDNRE